MKILAEINTKYEAYRAAEFLRAPDPLVVRDIDHVRLDSFDLIFTTKKLWNEFGSNLHSRSDVSPALIEYVSDQSHKRFEQVIGMMPGVERRYYNYGLTEKEDFRDSLINLLLLSEVDVKEIRLSTPELLMPVPFAKDLDGRIFVYLWPTEEFETPCILFSDNPLFNSLKPKYFQELEHQVPEPIKTQIKDQLRVGLEPMILWSQTWYL